MLQRNVAPKNPENLAEALGLTAAEAEEWQVQHALLKKLRQVVEADSLTHAEVARRSKSSRTRVTAILNGNLDGVSTDLLIRLLSSIGYRVRVSVSRIRPAA
ncbi:MAG: XRE family transcriptional regulator [Bryobacteraceae bacterium]|nr:XRE family transcriptional regulator [Bryobacteraceae bacterium]